MDNDAPGLQIWPPAYTLKKHPRAKRIRFRASQKKGLEVVVPLRFNAKHLPALLEQNRAWIEEQFRLLQKERQPERDCLPLELCFQAFTTPWRVDYLPSKGRLRLLSRPQQEIVLLGDVENKSACKDKLLVWVKAQAREHLLALLAQVSLETGLAYQKGGIRDQLTRWGSCSRSKSISLNYRLVFLPSELIRHTLIHELCHTIYFDHSERFWQLVEKFDPQWRAHRKLMRQAGKLLPAWLP